MRVYKLSATGAALTTGNSLLQIIESGRVRAVNIAAAGNGVAAGDWGTIMVGVQAVDEAAVAFSAPVNFAYCVLNDSTGNGISANVSYPVDYPVAAGEQLQINFAWSVNTFNFVACEILVFVE